MYVCFCLHIILTHIRTHTGHTHTYIHEYLHTYTYILYIHAYIHFSDDVEISPSTMFAVASILEHCSYINGSPQNTFVPGQVHSYIHTYIRALTYIHTYIH